MCGNTRFVCIMRNIRLIARLDVKGPNVIKGVHLECLRVMGKPMELAWKYYEDGVDELLYMDIVASLYQRNNLLDIVEEAVALVNRYDGEFPSDYFQDFLDYIDISESQFWERADKARSPHLWKKKENGECDLRHRVTDL